MKSADHDDVYLHIFKRVAFEIILARMASLTQSLAVCEVSADWSQAVVIFLHKMRISSLLTTINLLVSLLLYAS